ncbi:40S RIBOSOMAL PROTEIN [Salix koriyanagi]|uniref:40S RIBOSOMAL PROTEIN n=1 Tax=Salix koriyanagi TaxID=2511006 RepID=A0A9Q0SMF5_9ROSI|nr:40S RIBOSOMAL PROTEIN [Salix koriyanagi]
MALRRLCGFSDGELMRSDCKPCSRLMRQTAGIFSVGGAFGFWILCRLHYGPRITNPRSLRWAACGAIAWSSASALLVRLFSPECEPQNIAAYDKNRGKAEPFAIPLRKEAVLQGRETMREALNVLRLIRTLGV